ncbi:hypothetical protein QWY77_11730 [Thalassotalea ponticola]|uniref:hypothetical protein n=1 Tax=Thalassotalea ponticola TaxID=1523392 RepID=UPI0025B31EE8|nr:hypothetical protein [Thalassotalea ponticola]MDN3653412.1 hypothetical protein [Thalassotalea ponticola]
MRIILVLIFFHSGYSYAQKTAPISSCLSYEMNRINKNTGTFVLKNVFSQELFDNLNSKFPNQEIDWSAWTTEVLEYNSEDGKAKTKLKGCFDVSKIYEDSALISSIMRVSMKRFNAAMTFYSKPSSEQIPQDKVDTMVDGYEELLKDDEVKKAIKSELKRNEQFKNEK